MSRDEFARLVVSERRSAPRDERVVARVVRVGGGEG